MTNRFGETCSKPVCRKFLYTLFIVALYFPLMSSTAYHHSSSFISWLLSNDLSFAPPDFIVLKIVSVQLLSVTALILPISFKNLIPNTQTDDNIYE